MHLVPAPAVRLKKRRVLSRPGVNSLLALGFINPDLVLGNDYQRLSIEHFLSLTAGAGTRCMSLLQPKIILLSLAFSRVLTAYD